MKLAELREALACASDPPKAAILRRFFKTGPGEYGEGDMFRGIQVPALRRMARACESMPLDDVEALLQSNWHEDRLVALFILVRRYSKAGESERCAVYDLYCRNLKRVNNWDLVDSSAEHIVGAHLFERDRSLLKRLARSPVVWERRVAIMATFHFIRRGHYGDTLALAEAMLRDPHDLIQKAVGWMLREIGKRDLTTERGFLDRHWRRMPRTMLRYAIEKFPEPLRQDYLKGRGQ